MHAFWNNQNLKPPVARKLAVRHTSYWLLVDLSNNFTKFHDFSMIIQFYFLNSMIFPDMELFWVIFQAFQSLWEPCSMKNYPACKELTRRKE